MRSAEEFDSVSTLIAAGLGDGEIAERTGVPPLTVREWRRRPKISKRTSPEHPCGTSHDFSTFEPAVYCYVLGLYLGDGCISRANRVWRLRIVLDVKYPGIVQTCRDSIDVLMPHQKAAVLVRRTNCVEVSHYSKHWPCLFPQHGPGKKHHRPIVLEPWQVNLVTQAPRQLVRGLLHSDGCRVVANDRGVRSVRYHFTNYSNDIIGIYTNALNLLSIPWTRPSERTVAVYRKSATARLDEFVGPKD